MSLPCKKIYIDSKFKAPDSVSNSNFKIELPAALLMPQNTTFQIDDICIPHSWTTIIENWNDKLYLFIENAGMIQCYIVTLAAKQYTGSTLADELRTQLAAIVPFYTVTYDATQHNITITTSQNFWRFLTDSELTTKNNNYWNGASYDTSNPASANDIFGNNGLTSTMNSLNYKYVSNFLDLQPIRNIYISSPNLGTFTTIGARGESNIIKKVPVNADYGYMIVDNVQLPNDFLDCSKQLLKTLTFHLKDVNANYIPLHNANISFSIVFSQFNTEL